MVRQGGWLAARQWQRQGSSRLKMGKAWPKDIIVLQRFCSRAQLLTLGSLARTLLLYHETAFPLCLGSLVS